MKMSDEGMALTAYRDLTPDEREERQYLRPHPGRAGYSQEVKKQFLELMEIEYLSIERICSIPGMPTPPTVWNWMRDDAEFAQAYENLKRLRAARMIEQTISDIEASDDLEKAKLMDLKARHRIKIAGLLDPARWSESMQGALSRLPTGNAVQINIQIGEGQTVTVDAEGKKLENLKRG